MSGIATTKLSSKGQVVIPEEIRKELRLKSGDKFMVMGKGDTLILKTIVRPSFDRFEALIKEATAWAKKVGLKKSSVKAAIRQSRRKGK